jgi:hypothetical protein
MAFIVWMPQGIVGAVRELTTRTRTGKPGG